MHGNRQAICHLVSWFKRHGYRVLFVLQAHAISAVDRRDLEARVDKLYLAKDEERALKLRNTLKRWRDRGVSHPSRLYFRLRPGRKCWPETRRLVRRLARDNHPVAVIGVYLYMTPCFAGLPDGVLTMTQTIDFHSRIRGEIGGVGVDTAGRDISRRKERRMLKRGDVIIAIQNYEAQLFRELVPERKVITVGWASHEIASEPSSETERGRVFMAAGDNPQNRRGVEMFCEEVWPLVLERFPEAQFRLAGTVCKAYSGDHPNVTILSVLPDLEEEYRKASVIVNPVDLGTGLKIKTMEAISKGKALVSTTSGVEGVEFRGMEICRVAESWEAFAEEVTSLLEDDEARRELESTAVDYANAHLTEDSVYAELRACLDVHLESRSEKTGKRIASPDSASDESLYPDPMNRRFEGGLLKGLRPEYIELRKPILARLVKAAWDNRGFEDSMVLDPELANYDERVVEYPYVMGAAAEASKDGKIQLLDVGCVLNNACIAPFIRYNVAEMVWLMNPSIEPLAYKECVTYVLADMREQTLPDSLQFPLVTCLSTLEHIGMDNTRYGGKPQEFEGELSRPDKFAIEGLRGFTKHVAPGGRLLVSVPFGPFEYVYKYENPGKPIYYTFNKEMVLAMRDSLAEFDVEITIFKVVHGKGWVRTTLDDENILRHAENCVAAGGVAFLDCVRR